MLLPANLKKFEKIASELISKGAVREIAFSGPTYQVKVLDNWAFVQLDSKSKIKDSFCTCESQEAGCVHIAAAYITLFDGNGSPLHHRFSRSFWKFLFSLYEKKYGDDLDLVTSKNGSYCIAKEIEIKAKTKQAKEALKELLEQRKQETEETSLKFSNLSDEELQSWKRGYPSPELSFELSFWSDLAKWIFILCQHPFDVAFLPKNSIPERLILQTEKAAIEVPLSKEDLPLLIPKLALLKCPLKIFQSAASSIEKAVWNREEKSLTVIPKAKEEKPVCKGIEFGDWIFVPEKGFYSKTCQGIEGEKTLKGFEVGSFLNRYHLVIKEKLHGEVIRQDSVPLSYHLHFDRTGNLHILGYVFEKGDLSRPQSAYLGDWVYLEKEGFIHIEQQEFDSKEVLIPESHVPAFIWEKREWLSHQEGFEIHLKKIETKIEYHVEETGILFTRAVEETEGFDFGFWVYVPDEGFFPKAKTQDPFPIKHRLFIRIAEIPTFLRTYKEELKLVPGFWSKENPLKALGIKLALNAKEYIISSPFFVFHSAAGKLNHRYFDEFIYVEGWGFYEIPSSMRLPEKYRETQSFFDPYLFFKEEYPQIKEQVIEMDPCLKPFEPFNFVGTSLEKKEGTYRLKIVLKGKSGQVMLSELWKGFSEGKKMVFLPLGRIDISTDFFEIFRELPKQLLDQRSNSLRLNALQLIRLISWVPIDVQEGKELLDDLFAFHTIDLPDLKGLSSTLRPYQWDGVKWLWFLWKEKLGGLLCDEMGLGKTHQAMALIAACYNEKKCSTIVLCPLSVIYHWEEKLSQFLPGAKVLTYHGSKRELKDFKEKYDIFLTSYGTYRNDVKLIGEIQFDLAILDEIQVAKNSDSILWKALNKLKSEVRIGLTGTPIENKIEELKSLFDLVVPGYMPKKGDYKKFFVKPIEQDGNQERKALLTRFIKPFILRRKKQDVLLELPEKTEQIEHCLLTEDQKKLYNEVLALRRDSILRDLEKGVEPLPYIHIFALLSSLKQICNHPATYLKKPEEYKDYQSGKWELFVELLSEARDSGQKVVVFSQYLMMLDIIEDYLRQEGISFASIRGETRDRGKQIARFNNDPDCGVFVGSLQASGWGIDLTAASVVIHYDRWWNAAREDQATDRVHRMGQTRGVQVFKLVTKGTFEERIDQLIWQKGKLMEEVVGADDHRFLKQFDRNDLLDLLSSV